MPLEIYVAILVASSCIVVLTISSVVAAVYFTARFTSMERQVTHLEGELSGLIHESQGFVRLLHQVATRATGAMRDVGHMTRTAAGWTDRADRMIASVTTVTDAPAKLASKYLRFGRGFLSGVMQSLLAQGMKR